MSRSYHRFAVHIDRESKSRKPVRYRAKALANRAVRRRETDGGKSAYKRVYNSDIICDYRIRKMDLTQLRVAWKRGDPFLHSCYRTFREAEREHIVKYYRK